MMGFAHWPNWHPKRIFTVTHLSKNCLNTSGASFGKKRTGNFEILIVQGACFLKIT
jgi:hypothetical protein